MKKFMAIMLSAVMVLACVACGNDSKTAKTDTTGLKIAIVSSPSGVDDGSFNQDIYNGILAFKEKNAGVEVVPVREESGDTSAAIQAVADIVADYDVIVCCGFQFSGIDTVAKENPDVKFILIDAWPSTEEVIENIYAAYYAEQESGFYAGIAAALKTTTGKVAVVNGIAFPSNVNYQYGFECGVAYANATEGLNVEVVELASYAGTDVTGANVGGNYVGNFSDEAGGKTLGNALIAEGVDVLFVAAGGSGNGVFAAAKEATGVMVIGCDVDQYNDGVNGDSNIVLTSGLKNMHATVENVLNDIVNNKFAGANVTLAADTDSTGYISAEGRCQLSAEDIAKLDAAVAKVKAGEIVPAANFNGITPETFTW